MRSAVRVVLLYEAEILTVVEKITRDVFTLKVALVAPSETVTPAGTVAAASLLARETTAPPRGAGPRSVTVPVEEPPPLPLARLRLSEERAAGGVWIGIAAASGQGPKAAWLGS